MYRRGEGEGGTSLRRTVKVIFVYNHGTRNMSDVLRLGLFGRKEKIYLMVGVNKVSLCLPDAVPHSLGNGRSKTRSGGGKKRTLPSLSTQSFLCTSAMFR